MFKPGKMVTHTNKSHYAEGGRVQRLSTNVEDRRVDHSWNAKAKAAIDARFDPPDEEDDPKPYQPDGPRDQKRYDAINQPAGVKGRTPDNNGIEDSFTKTSQFTGDDPWEPRQQRRHGSSTVTRGNQANVWDAKAQKWGEDGSTPGTVAKQHSMLDEDD